MPTVFPHLERLRYFHGQLLGASDLQREQDYFREKLKLRNRCLHGYGVVCGLHIEPVEPPEDCLPKGGDHDGYPPWVRVTAGVAVDCQGNEIIVAYRHDLDLLKELSAEDRRRFRDGYRLYVCIEYCEQPVRPTRGVYADSCGNTADCSYGWTRDSYRLRVTLTPPPTAACVDGCCDPCDEACLLLARIDDVKADEPVDASAIHMEVRRPLSRYWFTTITGISWTHGGTYTRDETKQVLGTDDPSRGLVVEFSNRVRTRTLVPGVVDVQVVEGGAGRNAETWFVSGEFADLPKGGFTTSFRFRQTTGETLQHGDQVRITVRTPFILDGCCYPVDGTHVGGRVPLLPGYSAGRLPKSSAPDPCAVPPSGIAPWTSGAGTGAGTFESWFYVN